MSFLHVLGTIGKDILKVVPVVGSLVPGPIGIAISTIGSVVKAEISGGTGPEKKAIVTSDVATTVAAVPAENKIQIINDMIEAVVAFLNALGKLFPSPPPTP